MIGDLDPLMQARGLSAIIVPLHESMHSAFRWIARGAKLTKGYAVKVAGKEPVLVAYPMEREEAAASGLTTRLVHDFGYDRMFRDATPVSAYGEFFDVILRELGASDTVAFFGNVPVHLYVGIAGEMKRRGWNVGSDGVDLIQLARKRKDDHEIEIIRSVGARTEQVVDGVRTMLRERRGLRIGDIKAFITSEITRLGMIEDHETIVSQGRHAGVPHSRGDAGAVLRESVPLVIDIFPSDRATGYFFDLTRTFCTGTIPEELHRVHGEVKEAFERARDAMKPDTPASSYQALVCNFFESKGYSTIRKDPATLAGYVHGLGHGVGLDIHEKPSFALQPSNQDRVETGDILTIEPGLYFPEREIGVRIEDTFVVRQDGVESLCHGSRELEP
ncbi:MAG TPA: Xaa-Pro peptidase family protein [Thermoanaerobaculia bacterium]|nr:Xaa-Pro peptidase family protein [Thermoanaerobaculia bacterium]